MRIDFPIKERKYVLKGITLSDGDVIDFGWKDETGDIMIMESVYIESDKDVVMVENHVRIAQLDNPMRYRYRRVDGNTSDWLPSI